MYHPTGRVLAVLELLQIHPGISASDLAERLEVDTRTIRRYIVKLEDCGIPVETIHGRHGGYKLQPGYKLPPLNFTGEEAAAIMLGLAGFSILQQGQSTEAADSALAKIGRVLPLEIREKLNAVSSMAVIGPSIRDQAPPLKQFILLSTAISERQVVEIEYSSAKNSAEKRQIEPLYLGGKDGLWYILAFCRLRNDYRIFRLDRVSKLRETSLVYRPHGSLNPAEYFRKHITAYPGEWTLEIEFAIEYDYLKKRIPERYGKLEKITDQKTLFRGPASDLAAAGKYIISLNIPFRVLAPVELKRELKKIAKEVSEIAEL